MMSLKLSRVGLLAVGVCTLASVAARADLDLKYKFKTGNVTHYILDNVIDGKFDFNGANLEFLMKLGFDVSWKVDNVADDGSAELTQTIDRVRIKAESSMIGDMDYDSDVKGEEPASPLWETMKGPIGAMVKSDFHLKVSPAGKVSDIKLPEKLEAIFKEQAGRRGGPGQAMNPLGKEQVVQTIERSFAALPDKPIAEKGTWKQKVSNKLGRAGTQHATMTYTLAKVEKKGEDDVAVIDNTSQVAFEPMEGSDIDAEITEQKGAGTLSFDVTKGKALESKFVQKLILKIVARDNEIVQDFTTTTTMKEGVSPPPAPAKPADKKKDSAK